MYYLNSRYYNPEIGRFISSDGILGEIGNLMSNDMYAYCANNPLGGYANHKDPNTTDLSYINDSINDVIDTNYEILLYLYYYEVQFYDGSFTLPIIPGIFNVKIGITLIKDKKTGEEELYFHRGFSFGISSGASLSLGKMKNYRTPADYEGDFIHAETTYFIGKGYCLNPNVEYEKTVRGSYWEFSTPSKSFGKDFYYLLT